MMSRATIDATAPTMAKLSFLDVPHDMSQGRRFNARRRAHTRTQRCWTALGRRSTLLEVPSGSFIDSATPFGSKLRRENLQVDSHLSDASDGSVTPRPLRPEPPAGAPSQQHRSAPQPAAAQGPPVCCGDCHCLEPTRMVRWEAFYVSFRNVLARLQRPKNGQFGSR